MQMLTHLYGVLYDIRFTITIHKHEMQNYNADISVKFMQTKYYDKIVNISRDD